MASPTRWTWVWVNSRSWWWTGRPGVLFHRVTKSRTWVKWLSMHAWKPTRPFRTNTPKRCLFHYRGLECKSRSQETPGVTGTFGLGIWNEAGQRLIEFCQENAQIIANTLFQQHKRRLYTWTSPMVNTEIRLIIFFAAKDGEALYSQQKQDQQLTVAQIMNSLLPNSDLNWRKWGKPLDHSGMT